VRDDERVVRIALFSVLSIAGAVAADQTILAVGAHAGDMELTAGALLAKQAMAGDRVVLVHLSLGEAGNPKMSREDYGKQKRNEAVAAAKALGAEVIFGPYQDALIPRGDEAVRWLAGVISKVKPSHIITHWKNSIHRDHALVYQIVNDAVLLASVEGTRGVKGPYYAENWEDPEGFRPYLYFDVTAGFEAWKKAVTQYQFVRGGIAGFPYLDYYESLARVRGAEAGGKYAESFDVDESSKKRVLDQLR
jgi:LmbE family N-acetylglucosaminyl deacetylase